MEIFTGLDPVMLLVAWVVVFVFGVLFNTAGAKFAEYLGGISRYHRNGDRRFYLRAMDGAIVGSVTNVSN
jgi:hypothetical protein